MRRLGGSTLSPWPGYCLPLVLPGSVSRSPPGTHPSPLYANYTCANQPTSNEARPLALPVERVEPLLSSALGGWVERGPAHGVCREPHFA